MAGRLSLAGLGHQWGVSSVHLPACLPFALEGAFSGTVPGAESE